MKNPATEKKKFGKKSQAKGKQAESHRNKKKNTKTLKRSTGTN